MEQQRTARHNPVRKPVRPLTPVYMTGMAQPPAHKAVAARASAHRVLPGAQRTAPHTAAQPNPAPAHAPQPRPSEQHHAPTAPTPSRPPQAAAPAPRPKQSLHAAAEAPAHTPTHAPASAGTDEPPVVSIRISVPEMNAETVQAVLAWRPTAKQVWLAIALLCAFTVGYQAGRGSMRNAQPAVTYQQATRSI